MTKITNRALAPAFILSLALGATASAAAGVPTGDQQISYSAFANGPRVSDTRVETRDLSTPISFAYGGGPNLSAVASAASRALVSVTASTSSAVANTSAFARAALDYFIYVSGPNTTFDVPIHFTSTLSVRAAGASSVSGNEASTAIAGFTLQEYNADPYVFGNAFVGQLYDRHIAAQTRYNSLATGSDVWIADFVNVPVGSFIAAIITSTASVQDGGFASAYADPYFYIDPLFVSAHPGYNLSISPFVGNDPPVVAGVPEPRSWLMLITGIGLVGSLMRRKRGRRSGALSLNR